MALVINAQEGIKNEQRVKLRTRRAIFKKYAFYCRRKYKGLSFLSLISWPTGKIISLSCECHYFRASLTGEADDQRQPYDYYLLPPHPTAA